VGTLLALWINVAPVTHLTQPKATARVAHLPATAPFFKGQKVMILAPHPDDETLCCAGMIQQAQAAGAQVYVTFMTSGDGFEFDAALVGRQLRPGPQAFRQLAMKRMGEARAAARALQLPASHLSFLGYPDGGLLHLFLEHYAAPYLSPTSKLSQVSYDGTATPGRPYTGRNMELDLAAQIEALNPDLVSVPAPQDAHADHRATSYTDSAQFPHSRKSAACASIPQRGVLSPSPVGRIEPVFHTGFNRSPYYLTVTTRVSTS